MNQLIYDEEVGKNIETTIYNVHEYNKKRIRIQCNPRPFINQDPHYHNCLYLKKSHPNFINLYNKLIIGKSYKFIFKKNLLSSKPIIVNILELDIYNISGIVRGLINIGNEYTNMKNYHEIIMDKDNKCRILANIEMSSNIVINKKYLIHYKKGFGQTFYKAIKVEEI